MLETLSFFVVLFAGGTATFAAARRFPKSQRRIVFIAAAAHVLAAVAQVVITRRVYGGGDMLLYFRLGGHLAELMHRDFVRYFPEVLALALQREVDFPFFIIGQGRSTGTMSAIAALLVFVEGANLYAICLTVAFASLGAKLALAHSLTRLAGPRYASRVLWAVLLVPSVVFWSCALLKEPIAMVGLFLALHGLERTLRKRSAVGLVIVCVGLLLVSLTKPYILFPLIIAVAVFLYWRQSMSQSPGVPVRIRPAIALVAIAAVWGGVALLGEAFPAYSAERFAESAAHLQGVGQHVSGGSTYVLGDADARSLPQQLAFVPLALSTALFRPLVFEVRNAQLAVAALEMAVLVLLGFRVLVRRGVRWTLREVLSSPVLAFCAAFVLVMGTAVGLASTNLGTLSRYRAPMIPLYALAMLILSAPPATARVRSLVGPTRQPPRRVRVGA